MSGAVAQTRAQCRLQARRQSQRVTAIAAPPRPPSGAAVEPLAEELKPLVEEKGVDWDKTGLKYLSNEARVRKKRTSCV